MVDVNVQEASRVKVLLLQSAVLEIASCGCVQKLVKCYLKCWHGRHSAVQKQVGGDINR